ncbi:MAG: hypothetical protein AAGD18_20365 [Actinomycetota bacterium]
MRWVRALVLGVAVLAATGGVAGAGADFHGSTGAITLNQPIVGMAATPTGDGYWLVASDGGIFAFGDAEFFGSTGAIALNQPIVGMAATPTGDGYWLVASDGGIFAFGDAEFRGSIGGTERPWPVVAIGAIGDGYWLIDARTNLFGFSDVPTPPRTAEVLDVVAVAADVHPDGEGGMWAVQADGQVLAVGVEHHGDLAGQVLNQPIVGIAGTPTGDGYWLVASDGGIFAFGDAEFFGSTGAIALNQPIVGMAPTNSSDGYWLVASDGGIFAFPTGTPDPTPRSRPQLGGCDVLPADNPWNQPIDDLPAHPDSDAWIARAGADRNAHPDFGANWNGGPFGIPFVVVDDTQPDVPITFTAYGSESDPGPYPVPLDAPVEGGSDRHVLVLESTTCTLYELFAAEQVGAGWEAQSGAVFDLGTNELRPLGWTSADAAGLPILPGLVRYDEVAAGSIDHALRVTFACTQRGYVLPATHQAGVDDPSCPPMGARLRLRTDIDLSGYSGQSLVVMEALRTYGAFVADNGSSFYFSGAPDVRWSDQDLNQIKTLVGSDFEFVDTGPIRR